MFLFAGWRNSHEGDVPKASTEIRVVYGAEMEVCDCYVADETSKMKLFLCDSQVKALKDWQIIPHY